VAIKERERNDLGSEDKRGHEKKKKKRQGSRGKKERKNIWVKRKEKERPGKRGGDRHIRTCKVSHQKMKFKLFRIYLGRGVSTIDFPFLPFGT